MFNKKLFALILATAATANMVACAQADNNSGAPDTGDEGISVQFSLGLDENGFYKNYKALDLVTLPSNYDAVPLSSDDIELDEKQVDQKMLLLASAYGSANVVEQPAKFGDCVTADFVGRVDDIEFEGGSAEGATVIIGSGNYIDGFEEQLIGHSAGEEFDIAVTFPEEYGTSTDSEGNLVELSNKEVSFHVILRQVSELDFTDEDVVALLNGETVTLQDGTPVDTVESLRAYCKEELETDAKRNAVYDYMMNYSIVSEIPSQLIEDQRTQYRQDLEMYAAQNGTTAEEWCASNGFEDVDTWVAYYDDYIKESVKAYLIFQAVAEAQDYTVSDEDILSYFLGDKTSVNSAISYYGKEYVNQNVMYDAMGKWLAEHALISPIANTP